MLHAGARLTGACYACCARCAAPTTAAFNPATATAFLRLAHHVSPRLWPPFVWEGAMVFTLLTEPGSGWLIATQEDLTSPQALLSPVPLLGWLYGTGHRRLVGLGISCGWAVAVRGWQLAAQAYSAHVVAAGGDAGPPPGLAGGKLRRQVRRTGGHVDASCT
jgi:hypothetical protein